MWHRLPTWWGRPAHAHDTPACNIDAFASAEADESSNEAMLQRIEDLFYPNYASALNVEAPSLCSWRWANEFNQLRKDLDENLFLVKNSEHEAWFCAIDPVIDGHELSDVWVHNYVSSAAFRNFCDDPCTNDFLKHMAEQLEDFRRRLQHRLPDQ